MLKSKKLISMIGVFAVMAFTAAPIAGATTTESIFPDLSLGSPSLKAVEYLNRENIIKGGDDGMYHPLDNLNRAEWATILTRVAGANPSLKNYNNCFPDVKDEWYAPGACLAKQQGWMTGYLAGELAGKFGPDLAVSNAEVLVTLQRLEKWDVQAGDNWYKPAFDLANNKNIYTNIDSVVPVPREQLADLLFRSLATFELGKNIYSDDLADLVFSYNIYDLVDIQLNDYSDYYIFDALHVPRFEDNSSLVCDKPENTCTPTPYNFEVGDEFQAGGYKVVISNMHSDKIFLEIDEKNFELGVMESVLYPEDDPVFSLTVVDFDNDNGTVQLFIHIPEVTPETPRNDMFIVNFVDTTTNSQADVTLFEELELDGPHPPSEAAGSDPNSCFVLAFYKLGIEVQMDGNVMSTLDTGLPYVESSALINVDCDYTMPTYFDDGSVETVSDLADEFSLRDDNLVQLNNISFSGIEGFPQVRLSNAAMNNSSAEFNYDVRTIGIPVKNTQILLYDNSYKGWVYGYNSALATTIDAGTDETDEITNHVFTVDKVKINGNTLNSLADIDPSKGFIVQTNLTNGYSYLSTTKIAALGNNAADDDSSDIAESANELTALPLLSEEIVQEFNFLDGLKSAFTGIGIEFNATNIMTGNNPVDTNVEVFACGNDLEGTIRLSSTFEVLPDPTSVARRFKETGRPQQGAKYLLFFSIYSSCDINGDCQCLFNYRIVDVETRVINAAGYVDGACADLAKSFSTMISDLEKQMGKTLKTENPIWNTSKNNSS